MSQYLGDISAYALAVSQGYTGTEEEYAELMASYATVGQTAVTAAQTATTKASEAATSATTATNKASEATTAATTATTKAGEASTSASTATSAKDTAVSASQTATTKATEATTAAATAVSAKDDAVSANTAAQSAKTAAQTAQTGAETAAASVQSSAAQIQTNADDISELKEDLTATNAEVTDIRVGADGTTYNSAGAAVRGQISDLKSALSDGLGGNTYTKDVASANTNNRIDFKFVKGLSCVFTNNLNGSCSLNLYKSDGTFTTLTADLHAGKSFAFVADSSEYTQIGGYCAGTGSIKLDVIGVNDQIEETKDLIYTTKNVELSDLTWTSGYITVANGGISAGAAYRYSDLIPVRAGDTIQYNLYNANNVAATICAYDSDGDYQMVNSLYYDSAYSSGVIVNYNGSYTVPSNTHYVRICHNVNYGGQSVTIPELYNVIEQNTDDIDALKELVNNPWINKKWVAFGTSLTDNWSDNSYITQGDHAGEHTGKYVPFLLELSKLSQSAFVNRGIAGGSINGHILYYIRYYTSDQANADLITIEGAVNDFASGIPLGQVGDTVPYTHNLLPDGTSEGSFAGACYQAFTTALTNAPNAVVVLLTETTGKGTNQANYDQLHKNSLGLYQSDYIDMTMKVAEFVGIPVINCGRDSMINAQNPQYIADHIHHTYLGGYQYARAIWAKLKGIPLKALTTPE